jgi:hypothetical protein
LIFLTLVLTYPLLLLPGANLGRGLIA